jgi:hypothetical protein
METHCCKVLVRRKFAGSRHCGRNKDQGRGSGSVTSVVLILSSQGGLQAGWASRALSRGNEQLSLVGARPFNSEGLWLMNDIFV